MFLKVKIIVCGLKVLFLFKMAFLTKQWFEAVAARGVLLVQLS
jgi:hypothetical protein